jgi:signal transduction histidine kinase
MNPTITKKAGVLIILLNAVHNFWVLLLLGFLAFAGVILMLDLPAQMKQGEKGQAAIQMLDSMRRPFLAIKEAEIRFIETGASKSAVGDFAKAVEPGNALLARYRQLAQYNSELSRSVARLSELYEDWVVATRRLFDYFLDFTLGENDPAIGKHLLEKLNIASSGFLSTLNQLGEGEKPIHADIDAGRRANHVFLSIVSTFFLCLMGLIFWQQRSRTHELESRVKTRTAELSKVNALLEEEIAERKQAEEALETYATQLDRSNRELQDFANIASHDLQEPLRKIQAFTDRLQAIKQSGAGY